MEGRGHLASPPLVARSAVKVPTTVRDDVVVAITRELYMDSARGHFTPEQKQQVRDVLEAGARLGYEFTWADTEYVELTNLPTGERERRVS